MLSLQGDDICKLTRYEHFMLLPCNVYSVKEGEDNQLPPIELLLGSSFMANESWVLDFGAKIIYKKKI